MELPDRWRLDKEEESFDDVTETEGLSAHFSSEETEITVDIGQGHDGEPTHYVTVRWYGDEPDEQIREHLATEPEYDDAKEIAIEFMNQFNDYLGTYREKGGMYTDEEYVAKDVVEDHPEWGYI
jgi:RNA binding exosome subunit